MGSYDSRGVNWSDVCWKGKKKKEERGKDRLGLII